MTANGTSKTILIPNDDVMAVSSGKGQDDLPSRSESPIGHQQAKNEVLEEQNVSFVSMNVEPKESIEEEIPYTRISSDLSDNNENDKTFLNVLQSKNLYATDNVARPKVGDVLKNKYRLEEKLGQGGMGIVFKALDLNKLKVNANNPYVVVKILLPKFTEDSVLVTGFYREAEKAQKLTHINIIKVFDVDLDGDLHFMVMEYLQGEALNNYIRNQSPAPLAKAWPIIKGMANGLAHAHEQNIIHRDFKPANVFVLKGTNEVKILDFGIASELSKADVNSNHLTIFKPNQCFTPEYASLETLLGIRQAHPRDDIYAFGLVVYELRTGKHPYDKRPASEIYHEQQNKDYKPPAKPVELNKKQWHLLSQVIAIRRELRPENLQEWMTAFEPENGKGGALPRLSTLTISAGIAFIVSLLLLYLWLKPESHTELTQQNKTTTKSTRQQERASEKLPYPPISEAGKNREITLGEKVILDGTASKSSDSKPLEYVWQLLQIPEGSSSQLSVVNGATAQFIPDRTGLYRVQLTVIDNYRQASQPDTVEITVITPPVKLNLRTSQNIYRIGQYLKIQVKPSQDGYLGVVYLSSTGDKLQIFPNGYQQESQVKADKTYQIPPEKKPKMLKIEGPEGMDTLVAVFSKEPLPDLEKYVDVNGNVLDFKQEVIVEKLSYQVAEKL
jgi:serine/threonine protein kinase